MEHASNPEPVPLDKPDERIVFLARDTPPEFIAQLEALAAGDFAAAGVADQEDERAE